jgi:hypothetical protein
MTQSPSTGIPDVQDVATGIEGGEYNLQGKFASLETQVSQTPIIANRIVLKHWSHAERERVNFWMGIFLIAILGLVGMVMQNMGVLRQISLAIAIIMLVALIPHVILYLRTLGGRFDRQWARMAEDGELFRFLRDSGFVLGHYVPLGKSDEKFTTHLPLDFVDAVRATETWLRKSALPDPVPPKSPPGFYVPPLMLKDPPGGATHRVYEAEYRSKIIRSFSLRVDALESGSDITIGFTLRPRNSETPERLAEGVAGRLYDRLIAAQIIGDIRELAGLEPEPIPATESGEAYQGRTASQAT